jgi:hypothetical protein
MAVPHNGSPRTGGRNSAQAIPSAIASPANFFTRIMSNASACGANPAVFTLMVALATSDPFLIPTHRVNALIMGIGQPILRRREAT